MDDIQRVISVLQDELKAYETGISAIRELQQYRAIGTPEECKAACEET